MCAFSALAQSPESFNYQAVIRNSDGEIVSNENIGIQFRLLSGSTSGNAVYQETFNVETTNNGLITLKIGTGNSVSGDFTTIDWSEGQYFIETSIDLDGGSQFEVLGTSQLLSVPYALYAKTSGSSIPGPQGEPGEDGKTVLSGALDPTTEGEDGDFFINTSSNEIFGPKTSGSWGIGTSLIGASGANGNDGADGNDGIDGADGIDGSNGADGKTILNGTTNPSVEGVDGDFYINISSNEIFGPKSSGSWGSGTSLVGISGADGNDGADGKTILNGTADPTTEGVDGDFYINTTSDQIFGPKTSGSWGIGTSLIGADGNDGSNGTNGSTVLNGSVDPTTEGVDGDFYINTTSNQIFGPKTSGAWGSATSLNGADGSDGSNGSDGSTILNGTIDPTTEGADGDFYINTSTNEIFGPKAAGAWGSGTSLVGPEGAQGPAGMGGGSNATYRWATFSTYSNGGSGSWAFNNDPSMFGGVNPSNWTDASALAADLSSDKEILRTLFQRKGYATGNAMIFNDELASFSSTNGRVALVLFRINNTTGSPIVWNPTVWYSAYAAWGERASGALNGVTILNEGDIGNRTVSITIPPNRVSTIIFVSTSGQPSISVGMRLCRLGFSNNSLNLPAGLEFVDDLDTATGGWEQ